MRTTTLADYRVTFYETDTIDNQGAQCAHCQEIGALITHNVSYRGCVTGVTMSAECCAGCVARIICANADETYTVRVFWVPFCDVLRDVEVPFSAAWLAVTFLDVTDDRMNSIDDMRPHPDGA
jgi:hypothetical protein